MNNNYVYARIGKGRKRHIVHRSRFIGHFKTRAGYGYAICGMGGDLYRDDSDAKVCAACLKKLERMKP